MNDTIIDNYQIWFIFVNSIAIIFLLSAWILAISFLLIVICNKSCQTTLLLLICNSCIVEIFYGFDLISIAGFALTNDLKYRFYQDQFCILRNYLSYVGTALLLYSFTLQAFYRYIIVIYPMKFFWQTTRIQMIFICSSWIFAFVSLLPSLFSKQIIYNFDNQGCFLPFQFSASLLYNMSLVYIIPVLIIIMIYMKLIREVHHRRRLSSIQPICQARRELIMVQRIMTIISVVLLLGVPHILFVFMSFLTESPRYSYRICLFSTSLSQILIMLALFKFSRPVLNVVLQLKKVIPPASV